MFTLFSQGQVQGTREEETGEELIKKETVLIPFSAETKQGKEEIWEVIESYLNP